MTSIAEYTALLFSMYPRKTAKTEYNNTTVMDSNTSLSFRKYLGDDVFCTIRDMLWEMEVDL